MFELTGLHVLDSLQFEFGHKVLVHVEQNVLDHDDAELHVGPNSVQHFQKLVIVRVQNLQRNRLKNFNRRGLNVIIKHLSMFVQDEAIGSPVELFVGERARLVTVDLEYGISDCFPMLRRLIFGHISIAHLISINQELLSWQL